MVRRSRMAPDRALERLIARGLLTVRGRERVTIRNAVYARFLRSDPVLRVELWGGGLIATDDILARPVGAPSREGYSIVCHLENRLRDFVVVRLYQQHGEGWLQEGVRAIETTPMYTKSGAVTALDAVLVARRDADREEFGGSAEDEPLIAYATLKELETIVVTNWSIFKASIPAQDSFKVYVTQLNRIRNRLAHSRRLSQDDLTRLRDIEASFARWLPSL